MKRRDCLATLALWPFVPRLATAVTPSSVDTLAPTPLIDSDSPTIRALANRLSDPTAPPIERARACFVHVRDQVRFGFGPRFHDYRASEVAELGIGFCNPQATLFTALLRASGIPARPVFVDIHRDVLRGFLDPGTPFVDHSYVEAFLGGTWVATDAYIVDPPLFRAAQAKLRSEGARLGYGTHVDAVSRWNGQSASFSQFVRDASLPMTSLSFPTYADIGDFYAREPRAWNRLSSFTRLFAASAFRRANEAIAQLRAKGGPNA